VCSAFLYILELSVCGLLFNIEDINKYSLSAMQMIKFYCVCWRRTEVRAYYGMGIYFS